MTLSYHEKEECLGYIYSYILFPHFTYANVEYWKHLYATAHIVIRNVKCISLKYKRKCLKHINIHIE